MLVFVFASPLAVLFGARGGAAGLHAPTMQYIRGLSFESVPFVLTSILIPVVSLDDGSRVTVSGDDLILRVRDNGVVFNLNTLARLVTEDQDPLSNMGIKAIVSSAKKNRQLPFVGNECHHSEDIELKI